MLSRQRDVDRFYRLLNSLESGKSSRRLLSECDGRMDWPRRGVYFFLETVDGSASSLGRVVRIGTHALKTKSGTTLWQRLSQHKGVSKTGAGNHRGSIFRLLVGDALLQKGKLEPVNSWGFKQDIGKAALALGLDRQEVKDHEQPLELAVSQHIGGLSLICLEIDDEPGPASLRGYIERNAIALLSAMSDPGEYVEEEGWLGDYSSRQKVRDSKLWNNNHVDEKYDPEFLGRLEQTIDVS